MKHCRTEGNIAHFYLNNGIQLLNRILTDEYVHIRMFGSRAALTDKPTVFRPPPYWKICQLEINLHATKAFIAILPVSTSYVVHKKTIYALSTF